MILGSPLAWPLDPEFVRQDLVAVLCSGPVQFAELEQVLPDFFFNVPGFEACLDSVAELRYTSSSGLSAPSYFLRQEFFDAFFPFHWHLSAEQRESALEYMKGKYLKELPAALNIGANANAPLLAGLLSSPGFKSFLHNLLSRRVGVASCEIGSVLAFTGTLTCGRAFLTAELEGALNKLFSENVCTELVRCILDVGPAVSPAAGGPPRSSSLALEAKRRALDSLKRDQSSFARSIEASEDVQSSTMQSDLHEFLLEGCCVICQENADSSSPFGMMAQLRRVKLIQYATKDQLLACAQLEAAPESDPALREASWLITSCQHLIHHTCYLELVTGSENQEALDEGDYLPCPLCSSAFNTYLPLLPTRRARLTLGDFSIDPETGVHQVENWMESGRFEQLFRSKTKAVLSAQQQTNAELGIAQLRTCIAHRHFGGTLGSILSDMAIYIDVLKTNDLATHDAYMVASALSDLVPEDPREYPLSRAFLESLPHGGKVPALQNAFIQQIHYSDTTFAEAHNLGYLLLLAELAAFKGHFCDDAAPIRLAIVPKWLQICRIISLRYSTVLEFSDAAAEQDVARAAVLLDTGLPPRVRGFVSQFTCSALAKLYIRVPFRLYALPGCLDKLLTTKGREPCPSCSSAPFNPALCICCGAILCAMTHCCSVDHRGECTLHIHQYSKLSHECTD